MTKRGYTLIELVVAMGILIISITLMLGAFVAVGRTKTLTSITKESQQKTRISMEMITRLSRQAEKVLIKDDGKILDLYFNLKTSPYGARFKISGTELLYSECTGSPVCLDTNTGGTNLYEGVSVIDTSRFEKKATIPPTLKVYLNGKIESIEPSGYYSDEINLDTTVILEGIK